MCILEILLFLGNLAVFDGHASRDWAAVICCNLWDQSYRRPLDICNWLRGKPHVPGGMRRLHGLRAKKGLKNHRPVDLEVGYRRTRTSQELHGYTWSLHAYGPPQEPGVRTILGILPLFPILEAPAPPIHLGNTQGR